MAAESPNRRAHAKRVRAANVAGGRPHRHVVKLSDAEHAELTAQAEAAGVSVPRLLVESASDSNRVEAGRAHAVQRLLELDDQVRGAMNNLNQLTRYAHQNREVAEGTVAALVAATRAALALDATARWVMGLAPAVTEVSVSVSAQDLVVDEEWASRIDPDG
ncbi:hypothetical protein AB0M22_45095 [Nocardia sp. NPDC051756]|uniref:plasmid mobilization protein n=1 Tax=Nocardia sp. NPDC051756 TaxID=3154751 RepID=UPI00343625B7